MYHQYVSSNAPNLRTQPLPTGVGEDGEEDGGGAHLGNFIVGGVAFLAIAALVSAGMLHSLFRCGRGFLGRSYAVFVGLFAGIAAVMLAAGAFGAAVFFFAIFAFGAVIMHRRKKRIAFGSANLKVCVLMCILYVVLSVCVCILCASLCVSCVSRVGAVPRV